MESFISKIATLAENCHCGNHHPITIEKITVGNDILKDAVHYIGEKNYQKVKIIVDNRTFQAAGKELANQLERADIPFSTCYILPDENQDIIADERALVQVLLESSKETDVMVAVGAGTIHDIVRFCSTKMGIPFISIPTAPSVDGFTSMGAPLIVRGEKKTFQMSSPIAIFADLTVLKNAPRKMIAAGFGDMIAKFTSLADWKFGHLVGGEPYCKVAAQITRDALNACVKNVEKIKKGDEEGIQILIESLIASGLAMLLFGHSHPASAGEHHLSHYWEMEFLRQKRAAVLHGAKVGIAASILAKIYKSEFLPFICNGMEGIDENLYIKIKEHKEEIKAVYEQIPDSILLRKWVEQLGGETHPEQLGIENDLVIKGLNEAHKLRDRFTALKFLNEIVKIRHEFASEIL